MPDLCVIFGARRTNLPTWYCVAPFGTQERGLGRGVKVSTYSPSLSHTGRQYCAVDFVTASLLFSAQCIAKPKAVVWYSCEAAEFLRRVSSGLFT